MEFEANDTISAKVKHGERKTSRSTRNKHVNLVKRNKKRIEKKMEMEETLKVREQEGDSRVWGALV